MDLELRGVAGLFNFDKATQEHLEFLHNIRNSPVRKWFFDDRPVSMENHQEWFKYHNKSQDLLLVVKDITNNSLVGTIGVKGYFSEDKTLEFGQFCISSTEHLQKRYAPIILSSLFHALFDNGKRCITCQVLSDNTVLSLYVKIGFVVCDFFKDYIPYNGRVIDVVELRLEKERFYDNYRF